MNTWSLKRCEDFESLATDIGERLLQAPEVRTESWQSQSTSDHPMAVSYELRHAHIDMIVPKRWADLAEMVTPNLPWAEDHFQERVGGKPLNPPPSEAWWPFAQQGNAEHKADERFSHTYPERFWPRFAGDGIFVNHPGREGIRYRYGDLNDVIKLLNRDLTTRQAYLPVWFPEDTGSALGQRVPCTLGYHFLCRDGKMDIEYHIRSCDFMRHWRDDVYMAGRLLQWVCERVDAKPSKLIMNIGSFHIFQGDRYPLAQLIQRQKQAQSAQFASRLNNAL